MYVLHLWIAYIKAHNSLSYADKHFFLGGNALLRNNNGLPYCIRIYLIPSCDALVSTAKNLEKSGNAKIGVLEIAFLRASKACVASVVHWN